jgi:hypothetical protein
VKPNSAATCSGPLGLHLVAVQPAGAADGGEQVLVLLAAGDLFLARNLVLLAGEEGPGAVDRSAQDLGADFALDFLAQVLHFGLPRL